MIAALANPSLPCVPVCLLPFVPVALMVVPFDVVLDALAGLLR